MHILSHFLLGVISAVLISMDEEDWCRVAQSSSFPGMNLSAVFISLLMFVTVLVRFQNRKRHYSKSICTGTQTEFFETLHRGEFFISPCGECVHTKSDCHGLRAASRIQKRRGCHLCLG